MAVKPYIDLLNLFAGQIALLQQILRYGVDEAGVFANQLFYLEHLLLQQHVDFWPESL